MIGKGLDKRKTQGIRGIKAGGGDLHLGFLQSQAGAEDLCGLAPGAPVLPLPPGVLYPPLSRLRPPMPRKMLQGACRRVPGPGGCICEVCALSPYCV